VSEAVVSEAVVSEAVVSAAVLGTSRDSSLMYLCTSMSVPLCHMYLCTCVPCVDPYPISPTLTTPCPHLLKPFRVTGSTPQSFNP